jgi:hypothetical protein
MGGEAKAKQGRSVVEENIWRDPRINPDRAGTKKSAQMEKKMLTVKLEKL